MVLPQELIEAMRAIAAETVQRSAPSWADFDELQVFVLERQATIALGDLTVLRGVLPALARLRPDTWVTANEVVALSLLDAPLRAALEPCFAGVSTPRCVGRLLTRCTGVPVEGLRLRRLKPLRPSDSASYMVAGFLAHETLPASGTSAM